MHVIFVASHHCPSKTSVLNLVPTALPSKHPMFFIVHSFANVILHMHKLQYIATHDHVKPHVNNTIIESVDSVGMAPTRPLSLKKSIGLELPNADVLSLFRHTTCSAGASAHYNTLKHRKINLLSQAVKFHVCKLRSVSLDAIFLFAHAKLLQSYV